MVKSNNTISQYLSGSRGNTLTFKLHYKDLEHVMVFPIEVGKSYNKALVPNYFGCLLKDLFEFHNSQENLRLLHNTIADVAKNQPVEKLFLNILNFFPQIICFL